MSVQEDQAYFAKRERESMRRAAETQDPSARAVHLKLAQHYALRARPAFDETPPAAQ